MRKEIEKWAKSKPKSELVKAIAVLIEESHETEGSYFFRKVPYCQHSGNALLESDNEVDRWEDED